MSLLCGKLLSQWLIVILMFQYVSALILPNNETVPAVIVFGDSIVDTGNNNYISTLVKCNFPPYAAKFGVKKFLPPYLDPTLQLQDLLTGVSFASDQLIMFKEYIDKIKAAVGGNRTTQIVSKSIYIVCIGSDDIANTYTQSPFRRAEYDIPSYTDLMASEASKFFETLYGMGARRIGVFGIPAIGCVPSQRTMAGGLDRACVESSNEAAMLFNSKLSSQMDALGKKLPDARLVYLDSYNGLLKMIRDPAKYGFQVTEKGCCGTGNIEVSILCNRYIVNTCSNSSDYIFWDSYHPTEQAYYVLSTITLDEKVKQFF
ncbi:GDSL esterase/lipase [Vigna angularis]|uniref:GDSL esterase/lipase n=1 Tax=Phaseolus angularis TaxID=3914 RepID=A0A8T0L9Q1_PHAAN|nr:GDSL esterase/lipase [Vigna angularis]